MRTKAGEGDSSLEHTAHGTLLLSRELAREIELAEAQTAVCGAETLQKLEPASETAVLSVAGGYAVYCGPGSPVTQASALGLHGPVTEKEFDQLEEFYFSRKETVRIETCPLADSSLFELYRSRGYGVTEFSNVMVRAIGQEQAPNSSIRIWRVSREEMDLWALTVAQGFAENYPVTDQIIRIMKVFGMSRGMECYLAKVGEKVAGGATLSLRGRVAGIFGASTLVEFRNRGVQTALLEKRLLRAEEEGCAFAVSLAQPGSHSQRNITRLGFRTLYTRVKFEREYK